MQVLPIYCDCGITGFESPAAEYREMGLSLDELLIHNPNATFIGLASGNSMEGVGIFSGDLLIVDRSKNVKDGFVIVANLNGNFVCKILDKTNKRLLSASGDHMPVYITENDVFQLEGKVTYNVRRFDEAFNLSVFL
ncbi:MAG: S24 family peptidase [Thalassotalea sp.]|nr:S24 family peptidase [Thalassotalea sp.]